MKNLKTVTTLAVAGAIMVTPFAAFAQEDHGIRVRLGADTQVDSGSKFNFGNLFNRFDKQEKQDDKGGERVKAHATTTARVKAEGSIDARIEKLTKLEDRIEDMNRLSAEQKAALTGVITAQINSLTALKAKLATTTTATSTPDKDVLTKSNRVAALVMPQVAITAASNHVLAVVAQMEAFAPKLQARIASSAAAGMDVTAAQTAYTSMLADIATAKLQAQAAASSTVNLKADNGDKAVFEANQQVLKDARAKLKAAHQSLKDARQDVKTIFQTLNIKGSLTASTSASTR